MPIQNLTSAEITKFNASGNTLAPQEKGSFFGEDGFSFGDIIDIINPLQHIPVVNSLYRKISGDSIAPAMQVAGGALFGGPVGAVMSLVSTVIQSQFNSEDTVPDMPYQDTTINPATVAFNGLQTTPIIIGKDDYSATGNSTLRQSAVAMQSSPNTPAQYYSGSIGAALSLAQARSGDHKEITNNNTKTFYADNSLQRKPAYESTDGLMNLVRKNTERYTNVVTATNSPERNIDVIIGSG